MLGSLSIAGRRLAVLGDMRELGQPDPTNCTPRRGVEAAERLASTAFTGCGEYGESSVTLRAPCARSIAIDLVH